MGQAAMRHHREQIPITSLPTIQDLLVVAGQPEFVVLRYAEFIAFVAIADPDDPPDVQSVLATASTNEFVTLRFDDIVSYMQRFRYEGAVDEEHYLASHPDVRAAIERGATRCGTDHYVLQGYFERRAVRLAGNLRRRRRLPGLPGQGIAS